MSSPEPSPCVIYSWRTVPYRAARRGGLCPGAAGTLRGSLRALAVMPVLLVSSPAGQDLVPPPVEIASDLAEDYGAICLETARIRAFAAPLSAISSLREEKRRLALALALARPEPPLVSSSGP